MFCKINLSFRCDAITNILQNNAQIGRRSSAESNLTQLTINSPSVIRNVVNIRFSFNLIRNWEFTEIALAFPILHVTYSLHFNPEIYAFSTSYY